MRIALLSFLFVLNGLVLTGQSESFLQKIKQDSAVDLYLTLDWKDMERHKKDKTYLPGQIKIHTAGGDSLNLDLKMRTRGHMRLEICSYPPIKLKFDKSDLAAHSLSSMNEMDLVHHCHEGDLYDQYLLREYMCYKLFELISPYHFHAQLVRLHYKNPDGKEAHDQAYAFLVENGEELADRLHAKLNKSKIVSTNGLEKMPFLKVCLFEYMIGNTDWYIPARHNLEFIGVPAYRILVTVPFDFDYSGLVDAPYAAHHETIKLPSVTIRYYQGWCQTPEEVNDALKIFREQKETILGMCDHIHGFNERSKKYTRDYLEDFFNIIENPKKLENQIIKHCDMWPVK
ncbi:MAG TPA: hypothetical protein VFG10_10925 [Saprospiraceae bacterium]|nr:hypothetical protein [Saprospiraceae bacterium]